MFTQGIFLFSTVWSIGASVGETGRAKFDMLLKEIVAAGLSEETRTKFKILTFVDPPKKPFTTPFPKEGIVYDYRFVKEVGIIFLFGSE